MNKKTLGIAAAGLLAVGLLVWAAWPEPTAVETVRLARGDYVRELVEDARTQVRERYTVTAPLAGLLLRPTLKAGDAVTAGQVVAEIRPANPALLDPRSQAEQAERVAAMEATLYRAQANLARARAVEQQAQADLRRSESLAQQGFVSPNQQESAQLTLQQRRQERAMAEQDVDTATHDLQRLRIGLSQPRAPAGGAWPVRAPVSARVLKLHQVSEGAVATGAPLFDLGDPRQLEIVTDLLTEDAATLPSQARATLGQWGKGGRLNARLSRIEPGAFTKPSALGVEEQRTHVVFEGLETLPQELGDGYRMEIRIVVEQATGVPLAPVSAVFPHGTGHAVFVVEGQRVRLQTVEVISRNGQQAWLRTDLPMGTALVAYPPVSLRDGDRVKMNKR